MFTGGWLDHLRGGVGAKLPSMDEVRFGVVGLGMGHNRAVMISQTPGARLAAVCDLDETRCRRTAEATGCEWTTEYDELLARKDVDVIQVMVPSGMHAEFGIKAAQAGKHVVTTKPLEVSLEAADRLIEACASAGVLLAVDFEYRYLPSSVIVKKAIDQGLLGKLVLGEVALKWHRPQSYYDVGWRGTWRYDGGGSLMNQTIHDIDLLLWFMGKPKWVMGHASINTHKIETEDLGMAMIEFESGAKGRILGTTTHPVSLPVTREIHGDRLGLRMTGDKLTWFCPDGTPEPDIAAEGPSNIVEDVIGALKESRLPRVTGEEGRRSLALAKAIYRSAEQGAPVLL